MRKTPRPLVIRLQGVPGKCEPSLHTTHNTLTTHEVNSQWVSRLNAKGKSFNLLDKKPEIKFLLTTIYCLDISVCDKPLKKTKGGG